MLSAARSPAIPAENTVQKVFQRQEKKYLLQRSQFEILYSRLQEHMDKDRFGKTTVCSLYYDNDYHELLMKSIDKPVYKEKFRVRSYGVPGPDSPVFAEIKKKYEGIVYKRRVTAPYQELMAFLTDRVPLDCDPQIQKEIWYMSDRYHLHPSIWLAYDRLALAGREDPGIRVTFDFHMRYRSENLDLAYGDQGEPLRNDDFYIMEVKIPLGAPLWLTRILSEEKITPGTFSKVGVCYQEKILPAMKAAGLS